MSRFNQYDLLGANEVRALLGAWQDIVGRRPPGSWSNAFHGAYGGHPGPMAHPSQSSPVPPRNALVDRQGPARADRILLPMSSSGNVTGAATITARPQNVAYRPERIVLGGTPSNWLIDDIKVGNRSQLSQAGVLPGEAFANTAIDTFVSMETVQTAMDFVIQVTFIGTNSAGEQFKAAVFGTAAIGG